MVIAPRLSILVFFRATATGAFAVLAGFVAWILMCVILFDRLPLLPISPRNRMNHRCMSIMRKTLFGASIFMFLISATHLGLVMQELAIDASPISNRQAQVILAAIVVCNSRILPVRLLSLGSQYITGDLIIIWRYLAYIGLAIQI
jgi:hypothetical protein